MRSVTLNRGILMALALGLGGSGCKKTPAQDLNPAAQASRSLELSKVPLRSLGADCQSIAPQALTEHTSLGEVVSYYKKRAERDEVTCSNLKDGYDCQVEYLNNASEESEFMVRISFHQGKKGELVASSVSCVLAG